MWNQLKSKLNTTFDNARDKAFTSGNGKVSTIGKMVGAKPVNAQEPIPLPKQLPPTKEQARLAKTYPTRSQKVNFKIAPNIISPLPKPKAPVITPTPTPTSQSWAGHNIQIPDSQGNGNSQVPQFAAQALMNAFDDIGEATNAATVLHHPRSQTRTKSEVLRMGESWNHGENASYKTVADSTQSDGSIDRGLMRVNSNTFNGLMKRHPGWMSKIGVSNWEQMKDPVLNAQVGRLVLLDSNYDNGKVGRNPSYKRWYAAPLPLRKR